MEKNISQWQEIEISNSRLQWSKIMANIHWRGATIYVQVDEAIQSRHEEETEVVRLQAKLEVLDHLNGLFDLMNDREKLSLRLGFPKIRWMM
ncbi:unnamed protein product [Eruca vesicaria subsp. sativa]|uniref:Uncharacterized protein n=1 Tax=Eruca vesicaria subsp. sativa TaxID=29727 RepID=A0ABC8IVT1_ERUVS|nr:unnamed protein product [Eruca vesicaria subsp. sativa]